MAVWKNAVKEAAVRVEYRKEGESVISQEPHCDTVPHEVGHDACVGWPQSPASV